MGYGCFIVLRYVMERRTTAQERAILWGVLGVGFAFLFFAQPVYWLCFGFLFDRVKRAQYRGGCAVLCKWRRKSSRVVLHGCARWCYGAQASVQSGSKQSTRPSLSPSIPSSQISSLQLWMLSRKSCGAAVSTAKNRDCPSSTWKDTRAI